MTDIDIVDGFDEWLMTGTIRRVDVTLYNDPTIEDDVDRVTKWRAKLDAQESPEAEELDGCEQLEADVTERIIASKAVWTVKALLDEEFDAALALHPEPRAPTMPSRDAHAKAKARWEKDRDVFVTAAAEAELSRRIYLISRAVEKVVTARGEREGVTVEDLRRLYDAPYGSYRISVLWGAVDEAHRGEVKVLAPK